MRYVISLILLFSLSPVAYAKKIIVAVIDTGFAYTQESLAEKHLCKYGHKDFTKDQKFAKYLDTIDKVPLDIMAHGTHMVGIIDKFAGSKANYCIVIIKWFSHGTGSNESEKFSRQAIEYAVNLKVDVINYSAGGKEASQLENKIIKRYLNNGGIFIASAGNDGLELGVNDNTFYPAMYDPRIIVVGNLQKDGSRQPDSNYGKPVKYWEVGTNVRAFGMYGSGTSQATATKTGKIVRKLRK